MDAILKVDEYNLANNKKVVFPIKYSWELVWK